MKVSDILCMILRPFINQRICGTVNYLLTFILTGGRKEILIGKLRFVTSHIVVPFIDFFPQYRSFNNFLLHITQEIILNWT